MHCWTDSLELTPRVSKIICFFLSFFHKVASLLGLFWQPATWFMYFQLCCIVFLFMLWQIKFSLSLSTDSTSSFKRHFKVHYFNLHFNCFSLNYFRVMFLNTFKVLYCQVGSARCSPGTKTAVTDYCLLNITDILVLTELRVLMINKSTSSLYWHVNTNTSDAFIILNKWSRVFTIKSPNYSTFERVTSWHSPLSVIFNWFASRHFTKLSFFIADGNVLKSHFNVRTEQLSVRCECFTASGPDVVFTSTKTDLQVNTSKSTNSCTTAFIKINVWRLKFM